MIYACCKIVKHGSILVWQNRFIKSFENIKSMMGVMTVNQIDLTQNEESALQEESLGEKIELIIERLPATEVTLIEIMDIVGVDSLLLLTIFLSLVFIVPISIPGVSTVFGTGILLIGIARLFYRKLWLPNAIAHRKVSTEKLRVVLKRALIWFRRLEKISRPHRLNWLTVGGLIGVLNNSTFILAAILLMAPFGLIPFSNTLPALALIFFAIGLLQQDGSSILLGYLCTIATIIYFAVLIVGGGLSVNELFQLQR